MNWYSIKIDDDFGAEEFIQYLRQNKIKFKVSYLDNDSKHFEIYCDKFTANRVDIALDRIFDHIADNLDEATNNVK